MIRFEHLRPRFLPTFFGMRSENAAHRIAVEWERDGKLESGVFIPQRNTASRFNKALGGRVFPGVFSMSQFDVHESETEISVQVRDSSGVEQLAFEGEVGAEHDADSIFPTLSEAANFFSLGATGYSLCRDGCNLEGMELRSIQWNIEPMRMRKAYSRWFSETERFPTGSVEFDCALLMRNVPHEWHSRPRLNVSLLNSHSN